MSLYSNEPNNLAQETEGFACGIDINEGLHMLSESEAALYEDPKQSKTVNTKPKTIAQSPVPAPMNIVAETETETETELDDSIYDEPQGHVTFADSEKELTNSVEESVEEFSTGSIINSLTKLFHQVVAFFKKNWIVSLVVLVLLVVGCLYMCDKLPYTKNLSGAFKLSDITSSSFKGSTSSLGSNFIKTR